MNTNTMRAQGTLLTASVTDRILTYLLLPFGEAGYTNKGKITASAGAVTWPDDVSAIHLNIEHEGTKPVGKATSVVQNAQGIVASFKIAKTTAGNDLLVEAEDGLRPGVSVELDDPIIRAGRLIKAFLTGAGAVTDPAFPSAQLLAADVGELEGQNMDPIEQAIAGLEEAIQVLKDAVIPADVTEAITLVEDALTVVTTPDPAAVPDPTVARRANTAVAKANQALHAAKATPKAGTPAKAPVGLRAAYKSPTQPSTGDVYKMLAAAYKDGGTSRLFAALSDIVPANILGIDQGQFVGELWSGKAYERRYVPLFNHADLTSLTVKGWHWTVKPVVAAYAGNKTAVPSGAVSTAPDSIEAERIAGAHDIDRKYRDFSDAGFWASYYAAMTESYAQVSDVAVLADVLAAATEVEVGATVGTTAEVLTKIVDGAIAVLDARATPSFAVVSTDLYRPLLFTPQDSVLGYLNMALGLESGDLSGFRIQSDSTLAAGTVLVGAREAVTVHELGATPIRVEAENIALGGIDAGVFGYYAVNIHDASAIVSVIDAAI